LVPRPGMQRWRLTSATTVDSAAEQRSAGRACWRGNAAGLGGWTFVARISLGTLQATGMGYFGLYGATAALAPTVTLSAVVICIGIGFQRGTHTRWQLVQNDGCSGAPTLTNIAGLAVAADLARPRHLHRLGAERADDLPLLAPVALADRTLGGAPPTNFHCTITFETQPRVLSTGSLN